jgi:hypothetical protein
MIFRESKTFLPMDRTIKQLSALVETSSLNAVAGSPPKMIALFSEFLDGVPKRSLLAASRRWTRVSSAGRIEAPALE